MYAKRTHKIFTIYIHLNVMPAVKIAIAQSMRIDEVISTFVNFIQMKSTANDC